jgi:hypothetical protein
MTQGGAINIMAAHCIERISAARLQTKKICSWTAPITPSLRTTTRETCKWCTCLKLSLRPHPRRQRVAASRLSVIPARMMRNPMSESWRVPKAFSAYKATNQHSEECAESWHNNDYWIKVLMAMQSTFVVTTVDNKAYNLRLLSLAIVANL